MGLRRLLLVLAAGLLPRMLLAGWSPQGRCAANLKVLADAIEMYELDTSSRLESFDEGTIALLRQGRYLGGDLHCPGALYGYWRTRGGPTWFERQVPSWYRAEIPLAGPLEYRRAADGTISCSAHGAAEGFRERAERARPRQPDILMAGLGGLLLLGSGLAAQRYRVPRGPQSA